MARGQIEDRIYKNFITKKGLLFDLSLQNILRSYHNDNSNVNNDDYHWW